MTRFNKGQQLAEEKTGVNGWRIVRFLPPNLGSWYAGNYLTSTNMEVTASLGTGYDYTNEFMVPFGTYDEIMFSTRDMQYWLYTTKSSVLGNYGPAYRNVLKSSSNSNSHNVIWYNRSDGAPEDPWISINDHTSNPNLMLYGENALANAHTSLLSTNGGMCVFVRSSTDTESVNPAPEYKTLTFTHDGTVNFPQTTTIQVDTGSGYGVEETIPADSSISYTGGTIVKYSMGTTTTSTYNIKKHGILTYMADNPNTPDTRDNGKWHVVDAEIITHEKEIEALKNMINVLRTEYVAQNQLISELRTQVIRCIADVNSFGTSLTSTQNTAKVQIESFAGQAKSFMSQVASATGISSSAVPGTLTITTAPTLAPSSSPAILSVFTLTDPNAVLTIEEHITQEATNTVSGLTSLAESIFIP